MKVRAAIVHLLGGFTKDDAVPKIKTDIENPLWFLKGNCVCCACQKVEWLSDRDYLAKYPPIYTFHIGAVRVQMCEHHALELYKAFKRTFEEAQSDG